MKVQLRTFVRNHFGIVKAVSEKIIFKVFYVVIQMKLSYTVVTQNNTFGSKDLSLYKTYLSFTFCVGLANSTLMKTLRKLNRAMRHNYVTSFCIKQYH